VVFWFVILYLLLSVGIGLFAATRVQNSKDFAVAGRSLPLPVVTATVFATWFGAEAVLGISATFVKEGLGGVVADPFGSSMCLILAGLFFAPRLYRLNILTVGDYYRLRYNRVVEVLCTLSIVASYLGWVAAQFKVLGLVLTVVTEGAVSQSVGIVIGAAIVLTYTTFGGMFSVAILDFVQISVIIGGLLYIASIVGELAGGVGTVIDHAAAAGKLDFFPSATITAWIPFVGAWITMMLGSIPQQDVPTNYLREERANSRSWCAVRGHSVFWIVFCPDVSCVCGDGDRPSQVWRLAGTRCSADFANAHFGTYSDGCTDCLLRRRSLCRHELL
jgi:solute:Na+ symporter, SSS family